MEQKLDLQKYKKLLLNERDRIELEHRVLSASAAEEGYELADYDNHPADAASDTYERTKDLAIDENYREILDRISDALKKIDNESYGQCDRCGKAIHPNRLRAIPYATLCIECQETLERR
ncbi:MAG: TraR/DksA C4-type zinc finger protein [Armatimonadota bacterium]|nr:TraR/DksA C4-type zinc finger protein [bacterium]